MLTPFPPVVTEPGRRRPAGRAGELTAQEREHVCRLYVAGETKSRIARLVGCSRAAVDHTLRSDQGREFQETAREALKRHRQGFIDDWKLASRNAAKVGNHKPAKDGLVASGELPPDVAPPMTVSLNFALPGLPIPGAPQTPLPVVQAPRSLPPSSHRR